MKAHNAMILAAAIWLIITVIFQLNPLRSLVSLLLALPTAYVIIVYYMGVKL